MLDRDLAQLYGIKTKVLKQAVRRNIKRFPKDFMFEITKLELEYWRSQFVTSNMEMDESGEKMGLRYAPFCFTELAMLSSVLNSERAINVNIQIIRIFTRMRKLILNQKEILFKLEKLEKSSLKETKKEAKASFLLQYYFDYSGFITTSILTASFINFFAILTTVLESIELIKRIKS